MNKAKVVIKPLRTVWGWAHMHENKIDLHSNLTGYRYLLYLVHEFYHLQNPDWSETRVRKESSSIARFLWKQGFRWIDLK